MCGVGPLGRWGELATSTETVIQLVLFRLDLVNSFIYCLCDGVGLHCISNVKSLVLEHL